MSLHGSAGPSSGKPSKKSPSTPSGGAYTPFSGGSSGGGASPPSSSSSPTKAPFGGFKMPGGGGDGGGGFGSKVWGPDATGPGFTSTWSEGTKLMVAVGAFAFILLGFGLLVFGVLKGGKSSPQNKPSTPTVTTKFVPQATSSGGLSDLPLTFSDGTTADLLYNPSLDLANLGVSLSDSGSLNAFVRQGRQFQIDHGGASFVLNGLTKPVSGLPAPSGSDVPVQPAPTDSPGNFLNFKFGDWHVGVWEGVDSDQMSPADDATWAQNLTGIQTPSGFLVLSAKAPVKLTPYGAADGPSMVLGSIFRTGISLTPGDCAVPVGKNVSNNAAGIPVRVAQQVGDHYEGELCLASAKMDFEVYGTSQFVQDATNSLSLQNLKQGPVRTP